MKKARYVFIAGLLAMTLPVQTVEAELLRNTRFDSPPIRRHQKDTVPDGWLVFSSAGRANRVTMTRSVSHEGRQSVRMQAQKQPMAFQGICQAVRVQREREYEFVVHVYIDESEPLEGAVHGQMVIEWLDRDEAEISRDLGPEWDHELEPGEWHCFRFTVQAPEDAVAAVFSIIQHDGRTGTGSGTFYVDAVSVQRSR